MFIPNKIYRRRDLHAEYGGQNQGGISTPAANPFIFLFSTPSSEEFGYADGWDEATGIYRYSGEGQEGDMQFLRGNLAIRDHEANGKILQLFLRDDTVPRAHVRYLGQMVYSGYEERQLPDMHGKVRRAIIFHLIPVFPSQFSPPLPSKHDLIRESQPSRASQATQLEDSPMTPSPPIPTFSQESAMPQDNSPNVLAAFDMLAEQIETQITHINSLGASAFQAGNYSDAQSIIQRASQLRAFLDRVLALRADWDDLTSGNAPTSPLISTSINTTVSSQQLTSKLRSTVPHSSTSPRHRTRSFSSSFTPRRYFYVPILQVLSAVGGSASISDVIRRIEPIVEHLLNDTDRSIISDGKSQHWQSEARWARNDLLFHGCLRTDSPRGIWEISTTGRQWLDSLPDSPDPDQLVLPGRSTPPNRVSRVAPTSGSTSAAVSIPDVPESSLSFSARPNAFVKPVLQVIHDLGGSAESRDIFNRLDILLRDSLTPEDYRGTTTRPEIPRWRNAVHATRQRMIQQGFLRADSPRGLWEISREGRAFLSTTDMVGKNRRSRLPKQKLNHNNSKGLQLPRLSADDKTPAFEFYLPILEVLTNMGGSGQSGDVLDRVEALVRSSFKPADLERPSTGSDPYRWRNTARWARNDMVKQGLLKSDSPYGIWEISEEGRSYLQAKAGGAPPIANSLEFNNTPKQASPASDGESKRVQLSPGIMTPPEEYFMAILQALVKLGGIAPPSELYPLIRQQLDGVLKPIDLEQTISTPTRQRWHNTANTARSGLIERGFMKADSKHGIWEITDEGRAFLAKSTETDQNERISPAEDTSPELETSNPQPQQDHIQPTPLDSYTNPILRSLIELSDLSDIDTVRWRVETLMRNLFTPADLEPQVDNPDFPVWHRIFQLALDSLISKDLIRFDTSRKRYELTDAGRDRQPQNRHIGSSNFH